MGYNTLTFKLLEQRHNMTIKFRMTLEEYKIFCMNFISEFQSKEDLNQKILQMTPQDFQKWNHDLNNNYYACYEPVKELAKQIRGDYDPIKDYDTEKEDPLKQEDNLKFFREYRECFESVYNNFIKSIPNIQQKNKELKAYLEFKAQEDLLSIEVDGKKFKAIKAISVLWTGWECDSTAWVVEHEGQNQLVVSDHGQLYFSSKEFLENKIKEYETAAIDTKNMLSMLN